MTKHHHTWQYKGGSTHYGEQTTHWLNYRCSCGETKSVQERWYNKRLH